MGLHWVQHTATRNGWCPCQRTWFTLSLCVAGLQTVRLVFIDLLISLVKWHTDRLPEQSSAFHFCVSHKSLGCALKLVMCVCLMLVVHAGPTAALRVWGGTCLWEQNYGANKQNLFSASLLAHTVFSKSNWMNPGVYNTGGNFSVKGLLDSTLSKTFEVKAFLLKGRAGVFSLDLPESWFLSCNDFTWVSNVSCGLGEHSAALVRESGSPASSA